MRLERDWNEEVKQLLQEQQNNWPLAQKNFHDLRKVATKEFSFGSTTIRLQFNPARIVSSGAKVDKKSIESRKCFLCPSSLPSEQKGIPILDRFQILVNPFPIFPQHLTIPILKHNPQEIAPYFSDLLSLSKNLSEFVLFYNGPKCGASAPDHFHFQAGNRGLLPIELDLESLNEEEKLFITKDHLIQFYGVQDSLRNYFVIESSNKQQVIDLFSLLLKTLQEVLNEEEEPKLNLLSYYDNGCWRMVVFPRGKHRPSHYFEEGEKQILLSPASVDFGGLVITPQEKDFDSLSENIISDIFKETSLPEELFSTLVDGLRGADSPGK